MPKLSALFLLLFMVFGWPLSAQAESVILIETGKARLPVVAGSFAEPVENLQDYLERSGVQLEVREGNQVSGPAVYVGLLSDFGNLPDGLPESLAPEEFVVQSLGGSLFLLGGEESGVVHAVSRFLHELGFRWFFPGDTWTVIPPLDTVAGSWQFRSSPDFFARRQFTFGHGSYSRTREDFEVWARFNGHGGSLPIATRNTWFGIDPETDFETNPEWFAESSLRGEVARRPTQPCFSHPEVIAKIVEYVRRAGESGAPSVGLIPPRGPGFCECDTCKAAAFKGAPYSRNYGSIYARRAGQLVSVTSENLFHAINVAARVAAEEYPDLLICTNAFHVYAQPPSFPMEPNVFVNVNTIRTGATNWEAQPIVWGEKVAPGMLGIRDYWSVYQHDLDNPDIEEDVQPHNLQERLQLCHQNNTTSILIELSNNWGPRGLVYYLGTRLFWDVNADLDALIADFYLHAFGRAAPVMERYFARWMGREMIVLEQDNHRLLREKGIWGRAASAVLPESRETLRASFADLQLAATLADSPGSLARIRDLMMYQYYLYLRLLNWEASSAEDTEAAIRTARDETRFASSLAYTHMIHTRAFFGRTYQRRFGGFTWRTIQSMEEFQEGAPLRREILEPMSWEDFQPLWRNAYRDLHPGSTEIWH